MGDEGGDMEGGKVCEKPQPVIQSQLKVTSGFKRETVKCVTPL